jgi:hypothetical protein
MNKLCLLYACAAVFPLGCDIPYKKELDKAIEINKQKDEIIKQAEDAKAKALAAAEEAKDALNAERHAINRLYTED